MLMSMETQVDTGKMNYIIRDHDKELFEAKKAFFLQAGQTLNEIYGREVCEVSVKDQYYNMYDVIKDNMECVNVAKAAMEKLGLHLFVILFAVAQMDPKSPSWAFLPQIFLQAQKTYMAVMNSHVSMI